jgi:CRP/FNR family transcriptional regulator, cyclic AMP receptor protein
MIDTEASERFMAAPWLGDVGPEIKRAILNALVEGRVPSGATLLAQDQPNDHLSFLIEGTASIERVLPNGRREVLTLLAAPAVFGSTSFFRPQPPSVSVRATSDVWLLSLYHPAHEALRAADPRAAESLALAVLRALSERFDMMDKYIVDFLARHPNEPEKSSEWSRFRARMFEEQGV